MTLKRKYHMLAMELVKLLINLRAIRFTCIVAGPSTGKSTLLTGMKQAVVHIHGFVFADMSDIMEWHRDPANGSPYMAEFIEAKKTADKGGLVEDELTFLGLIYYLVEMQAIASCNVLRHVVLSGFPRTLVQEDLLRAIWPHARMLYINCSQEEAEKGRLRRIELGIIRKDDKPERYQNRWGTFYMETLPTIQHFEKTHSKKEYLEVPFDWHPSNKARALLRLMDLRRTEYHSMLHQLITESCDAWKHFDAIWKPKAKPAHSALPPEHKVISASNPHSPIMVGGQVMAFPSP